MKLTASHIYGPAISLALLGSFALGAPKVGVDDTVYAAQVLPGGRVMAGGIFGQASGCADSNPAIYSADGTLLSRTSEPRGQIFALGAGNAPGFAADGRFQFARVGSLNLYIAG